ncbi:FIST signal transduction protein [Neptunitalea lumnitzerae]|uniref:Histidine kinase n=1 Tax=Neptunitalea lumnitzerae TaxID=2965509 RepID=A0ABQ5MGA5_9FLAO|nr:FIST N-terminal domain-containing protein [Neptunitalea sp. Y10]GLB48065.1 histidine kinase [Neptunitalea sp. Y10]
MRTVQLKRGKNEAWQYVGKALVLSKPLVLVFGNRFLLEDTSIYEEIKGLFPDGEIVFGSTSGDISSNMVNEESVTITAIEFEKTNVLIKTENVLNGNGDDYQTGANLMNKFPEEDLQFMLLITDGSYINGSNLTRGLNNAMKKRILVTGGMCADDTRFERTLSSYNENPKEGEIVAVGFYGTALEVTSSIYGGWTPFGPERIVTKSEGNVLYELDSLPALELYKNYLGEKSKDLPASALLYPLNVVAEGSKHAIVRSILNIDEEANAIILAGDIPVNSKVQLMMTNVDNIANASERAARQALEQCKNKPELAMLVSCIGRKLVLDQRVEEEVEEVLEVVGAETTLTGFYSYGEIAPFSGEQGCRLHNQTMTITLMSEV